MASRSKRARKRHVPQPLFRRGGKRKGAGPKPKGRRAGSRHEKRPLVKPQFALHIVMRVVDAVGNMRRRSLYKAVREATITAALRERIRIVHVSIQRTHVHMLVEAADELALARGMQGFTISASRHVNTALAIGARRRRGPVFADRYHLEVIKSPRRARHALSYVQQLAEAQRRPAGAREHVARGFLLIGNSVSRLARAGGEGLHVANTR